MKLAWLVAILVAIVVPAAAHADGPGTRPTRMASFGDSYSSGEGLLPKQGLEYDCGTDLHRRRYVEGTTVWAWLPRWGQKSCETATGETRRPEDFSERDHVIHENLCHRHRRAYPNQIREELKLPDESAIFVACSGAITANVGAARGPAIQYPLSPPGVPGGESQMESVAEFAKGGMPDLVTIGIGGNDAMFSAIVTKCVVGNCAETEFVNEAISRVTDEMFRNVRDTFVALRLAFPGATIFAFGYPGVVDDPADTCWRAPRIRPGELAWLKLELLPTVNAAIADAAAEAGVVYVDITAATAGHGVCAKQAWINGVRFGDDTFGWSSLPIPKLVANESFHPNQMAHDAITALFIERYTDGSRNLIVRNPAPGGPVFSRTSASSLRSGRPR